MEDPTEAGTGSCPRDILPDPKLAGTRTLYPTGVEIPCLSEELGLVASGSELALAQDNLEPGKLERCLMGPEFSGATLDIDMGLALRACPELGVIDTTPDRGSTERDLVDPRLPGDTRALVSSLSPTACFLVPADPELHTPDLKSALNRSPDTFATKLEDLTPTGVVDIPPPSI